MMAPGLKFQAVLVVVLMKGGRKGEEYLVPLGDDGYWVKSKHSNTLGLLSQHYRAHIQIELQLPARMMMTL